MSESLYDIPLQKIDGSKATLGEHKGNVLLVVNVASKCGLTPQYAGLEKLHESYRDQRLRGRRLPGQRLRCPGARDERRDPAVLPTNFGVQFPMYSKIQVTGDDKHPLYRHLTTAQPKTANRDAMETQLKGYGMTPTSAPEVLWNFEKFLVDRSGHVVGRFAPDTAPDAAPLVKAIEGELAKH